MAVLWLQGHVPKVNRLPDDEIIRRLEKCKPLKLHEGETYEVDYQGVSLWNTAYLWDPKLIPCEALKEGLYELALLETYYTCGYIACFKPTLGEVLSQVPEHLLKRASHFEILQGDSVGCYSEGDGHRAILKLYSTKPSWEL